MADHKPEQLNKLIDAILKVAEATAKGDGVSIEDLKKQFGHYVKSEPTALENIGTGLGINKEAKTWEVEIGRSIIEGFKLMSGDIGGVLKAEFQSIAKTKMELEHTKPGEKLASWASEMAATGHVPSREELERMHDRFEALGRRQSRAVSEAGAESGYLPDFMRTGIEGTTQFYMDLMESIKKFANKQIPIYQNDKLHED